MLASIALGNALLDRFERLARIDQPLVGHEPFVGHQLGRRFDILRHGRAVEPPLFEIREIALLGQPAVVIFKRRLERRLHVVDDPTGKQQRDREADGQREHRLDERGAQLIEMLAERHLGALENTVVEVVGHRFKGGRGVTRFSGGAYSAITFAP